MPELKTSLKNIGPIRLLALDTSSLFLPFGRPVADYLRGGSASTSGLEKLLRPGVLEFPLEVRWTNSLGEWLCTTGVGDTGVDDKEAKDPDPEMAGFLSTQLGSVAPKKASPVKGSGALAPSAAEIVLPRMNTLPLRPRMTFGPPPAPPKPKVELKVEPKPESKTEPKPAPVVKPVTPVLAPRPVQATAPPKPVAAVPGKSSATPPPPAVKPVAAPVVAKPVVNATAPRVTMPAAAVAVPGGAGKSAPPVDVAPAAVVTAAPVPVSKAPSEPSVSAPLVKAPAPTPVSRALEPEARPTTSPIVTPPVAPAPVVAAPVLKVAASAIPAPAGKTGPESDPKPFLPPVAVPVVKALASAGKAAPEPTGAAAKAPATPPPPAAKAPPAPTPAPAIKPAPVSAPAVKAPAQASPSVKAAAAPALVGKTAAPPVEPAREGNNKEASARVKTVEEPVKQESPKSEPVAERTPQPERIPFGGPIEGPHLGMEAESKSFLGALPGVVKIGVPAMAVVAAGLYFGMGMSDTKTQVTAPRESQTVSVGEEGWSTEWASDAAGSRRGRQITLYRASRPLSDYQMQFVGRIESKSLGWVFRAADTKNYYVMKIEILKDGPSPALGITHFAVVEGRESSYSQKPLVVAVRPDNLRVKLDVNGPRFTAYLQGEPVEVWTDNRLKAGALGFMNERDERAHATSVQFSFPKSGQ